MTFNKLDKITKFELNNAHTFGVVKGKYRGFSIPVQLDDETCDKALQLFVDHSSSNKLYGNVLYLKTKMLSSENKDLLLNKDNQDISIHFETTGVYTQNKKNYIIFEVTKLCKR